MSFVGRNGLARTAIAVALAFALGAPAVSHGGTPGPTKPIGKSKGLEYFKAKYASVVTQTAQPVTCASGDVTGGGGSLAGSPETSALNESYPLGDGAWQAEATSTAGAKDLTGYAICDPDGGFGVTSNQSSLDPNTYLFGSALCGGSSQPVGGGGGATGAGIRMILSGVTLPPSTVAWRAAAHNPTQDDTLWDTYAVCGLNSGVSYRNSKPTKLKAGEEGKATAKCKSSEAVMGGGFEGRNGMVSGYEMLPSALKPWDSKDKGKVPDDGWQARALNDDSQKVGLVALAVCRKP